MRKNKRERTGDGRTKREGYGGKIDRREGRRGGNTVGRKHERRKRRH